MSVICKKDYSLVVNPGTIPPPDRYWRWDSVVGSSSVWASVDSYAATQMRSHLGVAENGVRAGPGGAGIISNCAQLLSSQSGVASSYYQASTNVNYPAVNGLSISGWLKVSDYPDGLFNNGNAWLDMQFSASSLVRCRMDIYSTYPGGYQPQESGFYQTFYTIRAQLLNSEVVSGTTPVSATFPVDHVGTGTTDWHHVVTVYNQITNVLSIWLDGVMKASVTPSTPPSLTPSGGVFMTVGDGIQFGGAWTQLHDECGFWTNHALNSVEIALLYNAGAGSRPPGA